MKKIFLCLMAAASISFGLTSCEPQTNVAPGGTAVEKLAGEWQVHVDVIDVSEGDSAHYGDYYGYGDFIFRTFNTASDAADKLYIYENSFWGAQAVCNCDLNTNTIFADGAKNILAKEEETVRVSGKIMPNGCLNLHGKPNDSICVDVVYSSDPTTVYRYEGSRYTGFYE